MYLHVVPTASKIANIVLITILPAIIYTFLIIAQKVVMPSFVVWKKITIELKHFEEPLKKISYFKSSR